jgi:hypothetical protein
MSHYYCGWNYSQVKETLWNCRVPYKAKMYWVANRHGVTMNSDSEEGIKRMIDVKNHEMRHWQKNGWGK